MMKFREIFRDQSFWTLLLINISIIIYYLYYGTGFKTLVWIYWSQSAIIGLFTFLNLLTIRNIKPGDMTMNDRPVTKDGEARGCLAPFFALHFGLFHVVYLIFIAAWGTSQPERLDVRFFEIAVGAFFLDQLWNFIRMKQWEKTHQTQPGTIFFLPYLRVVPMHLTILIPAFFSFVPPMVIFLTLKTLADVIMHAITWHIYGKPTVLDPAVLGKENRI